MSLLALLQDMSAAQRLLDLERLQRLELIEGDFEGSVTGLWDKLDQSGSGIVLYNSKLYTTKTLGFTSIPKGTPVELTYAKGVYYSKW